MNALLQLFFTTIIVIASSGVSEEKIAGQIEDMQSQMDPGDKISIQAFLPNNPEKSKKNLYNF